MIGDYFCVTLSVDALEWTRHWLGDRRCDLLAIAISPDPERSPRVRILAIESKARTTTGPFEIDHNKAPFADACEQVTATLDALEEILCPDASSSFFSDLKLAAFFEHLASEVLAQIHPIGVGEAGKLAILRTLTALSKRELRCDEES